MMIGPWGIAKKLGWATSRCLLWLWLFTASLDALGHGHGPYGRPYHPPPYYPIRPFYPPAIRPFPYPGYGYGLPLHPYFYPPLPIISPPSAPPVYIQRPEEPQNGVWYYCNSPAGYYPYVKECPDGWQTVRAQPPGY